MGEPDRTTACDSDFGSSDGPVFHLDDPLTMGVYSDSFGEDVVGIAKRVGQVEKRKGIAAMFRLIIDQEEK